MAKRPRVDFRPKRIAPNEWEVEAHLEGAEIRHITGFKTKTEIDEWMNGEGRVAWLRSQGYAK